MQPLRLKLKLFKTPSSWIWRWSLPSVLFKKTSVVDRDVCAITLSLTHSLRLTRKKMPVKP